ncbi:hypothetical protein EST38_g5786 [Candolleomyces aberdarensis]|uniref:Glycylpeptide N-tetradecanoyltransferase n=1 Tax=Candolleomyces aberdarensis TaxID=2316362 RepID=A0A4Q2DMX2_9AGAR|nr:hypothetical protein EST38_g5786 [Candolleomyces aberdarensis]
MSKESKLAGSSIQDAIGNAATIESDHDDESDIEQGESSAVPSNEGPSTSTANGKKKKKKKSKASKLLNKLKGNNDEEEIPQEVVDTVMEEIRTHGTLSPEELTAENIRAALQQMKMLDVVQGKAGIGGINSKDMGEHKFWATQPVPHIGEGPPLEDGYIEPSKPVEEVRQTPYALPSGYEWSVLDIKDPEQTKEVYDLLSRNYVEDDYAAFRFQYSAEFLKWALTPPGYHKEWHIGVRMSSNKRLIAFISGVPMMLRVRKNVIPVSEINYLCVHKKLRSKRLAPVLIKEVTRQVHLKGVFQAIYTAGIVIPTPVSVCRYYHRSLNVPKLIESKFSYVPRSMTLARLIRINQLESKTSLPGLREMGEKDLPQVADLFRRYMQRFDMAPLMTFEEVKHNLLSGRGEGEVGDGGKGRRKGQVTWSYVVEDPQTHKVTDFFAFYSLPSTIINNAKYPTLEAAYLYYYATETAFEPESENSGQLKKRTKSLIGDALIIANEAAFDVFNALTLMDNVPVLQDLKFGVGDGFLNFYLYNWRTSPLAGMNGEGGIAPGKGIGVVML